MERFGKGHSVRTCSTMIQKHMVVSAGQRMDHGGDGLFCFCVQRFVIFALHERVVWVKQVEPWAVSLAQCDVSVKNLRVKLACFQQITAGKAVFRVQHIHCESDQQPKQRIPFQRRIPLNVPNLMRFEERFPYSDRGVGPIRQKNGDDWFCQNRIDHFFYSFHRTPKTGSLIRTLFPISIVSQ